MLFQDVEQELCEKKSEAENREFQSKRKKKTRSEQTSESYSFELRMTTDEKQQWIVGNRRNAFGFSFTRVECHSLCQREM